MKTRQSNEKHPALQDTENFIGWVTEALDRMATIHAGMTRADLMAVFRTEGGISTRTQQHYVYQGCPYFKVDVQFQPAGERKTDFSFRDPQDIIADISHPYLQWSIID